MSAEGMVLMSGAVANRSPRGSRLPSTSTRVRLEPRPRRFTVEVPVAPLDSICPISANTWGIWFRMSDTLVSPVILMSCWVMIDTGLSLSRVCNGMREPVTSILCTFSTGACCA
jgi:hypothetical protein